VLAAADARHAVVDGARIRVVALGVVQALAVDAEGTDALRDEAGAVVVEHARIRPRGGCQADDQEHGRPRSGPAAHGARSIMTVASP
jgi:hypothetical protein